MHWQRGRGIRLRRHVIGVVVLLLAAVPLVNGPATAQESGAFFSISQRFGYCDTPLKISGGGFVPGTEVTIYGSPAPGDIPLAVSGPGPRVADDGTFEATIFVADFAPECMTLDKPVLAKQMRYFVWAATGSTWGTPYSSAPFTRIASTPGSFNTTWARTDRPVANSTVTRTWMWGPQSFTGVVSEPYAESPGGERQVRYYDKSRMEVTHPEGDLTSPWYVTNGLLVVEMVEGKIQTGDDRWEDATPADIPVAGDPDADGITYANINRFGLHGVPARPERTLITGVIDGTGSVTHEKVAGDFGVFAGRYVPETDHTVADVFWEFMNSSGTVYQTGEYLEDELFLDPFYATGYPITEAYWATINVGGSGTDVLWQCFERRCLTYTPVNPDGWRVESGNVGLHYHQWRYPVSSPNAPIAFVSNRTGIDHVWSVRPDGTGLRQLTNTSDYDSSPVWSPDGTRIAFFRGIAGEQEFSRHVYVMNPDGSAQTQITAELGMYSELQWSPDGQYLSYLEWIENDVTTLFLVRPDGSEHRAITGDNVLTAHYDWSPDSDQVVVAGAFNAGPYEPFIVDIDGGEPRLLTDTHLWGLTPSWSPDGSRIAYMLVADITREQHGVYVTNVDGSGTTRLTFDEPAASTLVWSPDGTMIAFTPAEGRGVDVLTLHADGVGRVSVTDEAEGEGSSQPAWSPDSQAIAFTTYIFGGNQEIYTVNADGTGLRKMTFDPMWDREPDWSPVGQ